MPGTVGRVPTPTTPAGEATGSDAAGVVPGPGWAGTALGPRQGWDPAVRAVVDLVLASPVPMAFAYGEDLLLLYNDGYAALIGDRHPAAMGRPAAEVFADSWHEPGVGDVLTRAYRHGESFLDREAVLPHDQRRPDARQQAAFTRGHSPVRDGAGRVVGVLTIAAETSQVTEQLQSLGEFAAALAGTLTLDDVARVTLRYALASFDADRVAFGVDEGAGWRMVRRVRGELLDEADERLPPLWRRSPADAAGPLVAAARSGVPQYVGDGQPLREIAADRHDQKVRALAAQPLRTSALRGALTVGHHRTHSWSAAERALLAASAELVGQAAERARRFETQHGTAQLLQRSMLPARLPDLPGCASPPGTIPASTATPRAATSTTRSCCPPGSSASSSATWPATTSRPPPGWARSGRRCARWR
ncbi:GAF domain-containing protein [Micromonospora olivasterospora]|uniref:GAF domain-containing protein n=1 Tax=Micromonospora olivasterospora TaxID=1880 RepID=A0A562IEE1_MICOL|nr:GAF domain-containing protein [Micromonospora olivasterospora]